MKEKTSLILSEAGSVKVLNENKKEVFITPEHLKIGKLKLSEILANQQETNNFVDIKLKQAERDFLQNKTKTQNDILELQNEIKALKKTISELVNFAVEN